VIQFKNVGKTFEDGFEALKGINLEVKDGELLTLIGPSGCGKTTTMRMINRLIDPSEGQILINGEDILKKNPVKLRRDIGYVIQQIGLLPHMSIEDNISIVPKLKKWPKEKYEKRVDELLDLVGLDPSIFKKRYPSELSGGQQQRIGVIRAMAADPPIILMDEPFSALDPISREQLQDELVKLQEEIHKTIVFVTHDMDEAIKIANRIAIMRDGEIVQLDTPDKILRHPKDDFVRDFIGEKRLNNEMGNPVATDLMMEKVITSSPTRGLAEAFNFMKKGRVDQLYIVGKNKEIHGVVSLEEVKNHYKDEEKSLADIMETNLTQAHPDQSFGEIAELFSDQGIATIPVVNEGKLIGIITRSSMIRGIAEWEQQRGGISS
jgi:osmoprotectant transport system ATP-binding protein